MLSMQSEIMNQLADDNSQSTLRFKVAQSSLNKIIADTLTTFLSSAIFFVQAKDESQQILTIAVKLIIQMLVHQYKYKWLIKLKIPEFSQKNQVVAKYLFSF